MAANAIRDREAAARAILKRHDEVQNKSTVAEMEKAALTSRYRQLSDGFKQFKAAHKIVVRSLPEKEMDAATTYFEEVSQVYFVTSSTIKTALGNKSSSSIISTDTGIIRVETARAPEPGVFDGNPSNWPAFRDQFRAEVHERSQLDDVTKLHYLKRACVGAAKLTMGAWKPLAVNYMKAWESLEQKYEDPYRLEQALVSDLLQMPKVKIESHDNLRQMIDTTTNALRQLEAMGVRVEHWDTLVIGLILYRLPRNVADAWEQKRSIAAKPQLADLMAFLEGRARGRIYIEQSRSHDDNKWTPSMPSTCKYHPEQTSVVQSGQPSTVFTPSAKVTCPICGSYHSLYRCPSLLKKTKSERLIKLKQLGLCINCLRNHEGTCALPGCPRCGGKHNSIVCPNGYEKGKHLVSTAHDSKKLARRQRPRNQ